MPADARAASITFDFTGTLANSLGGNNTVTGFFTLDTSGSGAVTNYSFIEPDGVFDTSNSTPLVTLWSPAISPATDFVGLSFFDNLGNFLWLRFQTTLAGFDGTFYTEGITVPNGSTGSLIGCSAAGLTTACSDLEPYFSPFVSGEATPRDTSPIPEPASATLLGIGAVALVLRRRRMSKGEGQ
jgi:hypothetical protein